MWAKAPCFPSEVNPNAKIRPPSIWCRLSALNPLFSHSEDYLEDSHQNLLGIPVGSTVGSSAGLTFHPVLSQDLGKGSPYPAWKSLITPKRIRRCIMSASWQAKKTSPSAGARTSRRTLPSQGSMISPRSSPLCACLPGPTTRRKIPAASARTATTEDSFNISGTRPPSMR